MAEDPVKKILATQPNECHFAKQGAAVCSPKHLVKKMHEYAVSRGKRVDPNNPTKVVETMKELLNCRSESCVLRRKDFISFAKLANIDTLLDTLFKPAGPSHTFDLLSNFNIDDVLDQFVERFPNRHFLHIPFQMRDFERVGTQLATVDLADQFKRGVKTFGVVLNTDWSVGQGIHWFCLFGENHKDRVVLEYFNSSGKNPLPEVQVWLQKTKHYLQREMKKPVEIQYSTGIEFQKDNHSCGVYCLCYIWLRLEQVPPSWFKADNFNDRVMHKAREHLFRHEI